MEAETKFPFFWEMLEGIERSGSSPLFMCFPAARDESKSLRRRKKESCELELKALMLFPCSYCPSSIHVGQIELDTIESWLRT